MRIIREWPDHRCDVSLAPIDVGFDVRLHGSVCELRDDARIIGYERDGQAWMVEGTTEEIAEELRAAGYQIQITRARTEP